MNEYLAARCIGRFKISTWYGGPVSLWCWNVYEQTQYGPYHVGRGGRLYEATEFHTEDEALQHARAIILAKGN